MFPCSDHQLLFLYRRFQWSTELKLLTMPLTWPGETIFFCCWDKLLLAIRSSSSTVVFHRAELVNTTLALSTTKFLAKEVEYMPWEVATRNLNYFFLMFDRSEVHGPMQVSKGFSFVVIQPLWIKRLCNSLERSTCEDGCTVTFIGDHYT